MKRSRGVFRIALKKFLGACLAIGIITLGTASPAQKLFAFPQRLRVPQGEDAMISWSRWLPIKVWTGTSRAVMIQDASSLDIQTPVSGHFLLHFRLFGWLPWRGLPVDVTPPINVVPGGESVGVLVHTKGLMVTALASFRVQNRVVDPAQAAGVERGDVISRVDGSAARSLAIFEQHVAADGSKHQPVRLTVIGARSVRERTIMPLWSERARRWQLGMDVQDRTSGVGTVTFYSPSSLRFTALGHSMTDGLTRQPVGVQSGEAMGAEIVGVVPAMENQPGQKVGVLAGRTNVSGSVSYNGQFGIVGQLSHAPIWGPKTALPLALPDQVHTGAASMITVLKGQSPQIYHIQILKTTPQYSPHVKGLLFRVTDPRLLRKAGGIVQGMSGSPIIQDGRVVGAVTHVLLSRPTLGFGCYAYWMQVQPSFRTVVR